MDAGHYYATDAIGYCVKISIQKTSKTENTSVKTSVIDVEQKGLTTMNKSYIIDPLVDRDCAILDGHCNCLKGFCRRYDSDEASKEYMEELKNIAERVREEASSSDTTSEIESKL